MILSYNGQMYLLSIIVSIIIVNSNAQEGMKVQNQNEMSEKQNENTAIEVTKLPHELETLAHLRDPYIPKADTPFFWHIHKSGGTSVKNMYSQCYDMVEASESGVIDKLQLDPFITVVHVEDGKYVNVDVSTEEGIHRAARMNLAESHLADIIVSPLLYPSSTMLFSTTHRGRFFAIFREPVDRVISLFFYLQKATWEPTYNPIFVNMTLREFAFSDYCESNFVGRSLLNKMQGALTVNELEVSKQILSQKCLIGLITEMTTSIERFDIYFGFHAKDNDCRDTYVKTGANANHARPPNSRQLDQVAIDEIKRKNWFDIILYQHALQLFKEQENFIQNISPLTLS